MVRAGAGGWGHAWNVVLRPPSSSTLLSFEVLYAGRCAIQVESSLRAMALGNALYIGRLAAYIAGDQ